MNIGTLGAGGIAVKMAMTVARMKDVRNYAIASRDIEKARRFAEENGFTKAYGSYDELLSDPAVDLVYIALPHSHHHEWTIKALNAGKNVLCEKAFSVNAGQAKEMTELAKEKGLLLAEAIWTRYMPSRELIKAVIDEGTIGELKTLSANLGYKIDHVKRIMDPALAGGSLLDLTVYPLNFASMFFGDDIKRIAASCVFTETGVDGQDTVMIEYKDGRMASLFTTIYQLTDRRGVIYGTKGRIEVENINDPEKITVFYQADNGETVVKTIPVPEQISGYEYEVLACKKAIEEGKTECPDMPHAETIEIMRQMDEIGRQFKIVTD